MPPLSQSSWPGLTPAIHVFGERVKKGVDARDKPGHDGFFSSEALLLIFFPEREQALAGGAADHAGNADRDRP
jgi:hypothetical protein